ncbi:AsnC family transcriptional regulator [Agrococcus sp. Marseille-Q4369]|uniref:Lrp/AsnC family transcriptional regulator n=1 Tax=Agrococcus sp. Marseille-Q4369 TaxID=2810513 RepID=UPI001B8B1145|nr:AsnC family transcriptional regulator [Agrococcus sp. Marseille-Q4369]QUW19729.1 AsnC family transcriptional regulator [Agrococcus sp. Marseille-Q4369]
MAAEGGRDGSRIDAALTRALQADGRASISELAATVGASRDLVSQRLQRLHRDGLRVVAALDPGVVGHHVLVHTMLAVDGPVRPVAQLVAELPDAVFVSMTSGALPLVVESRHGSVTELHEALDGMRGLPTVRRVRVTTYAEVLKGFFVSKRRDEVVLDELDRALIAQLQQDGRASYRALADAVHLSPSSARARVHRLIDAGVLRISAIQAGGPSPNRLAIGIGITAIGGTAPIRDYLLGSAAIDFAARSHGVFDFIATVSGPASAPLLDVIEELRSIEQVSALESWSHYDVIKEDYARTLGRILAR